MERSETASARLPRRREGLRKAWLAFNRWRRRRWPVRVVVLVLMGSYYFFSHSIIIKLMRITIDGIFLGFEPELVVSGARVYKAAEADRLRRSLTIYLDVDASGRLDGDEAARAREIGLGPADLKSSALDLDLNVLVTAARRGGLVPAHYTAKCVRRAAFFTALGETEAFLRPWKAEIDGFMADAYRVPGNWTLRSWCVAAFWYVCIGMAFLGVADWVTAVAWLLFCCLGARLAVLLWGERARRIAPWVPAGVLLVLTFVARARGLDRGWTEYLLRMAGWVVLSFLASYCGSRHDKPGDRSTPKALRVGMYLGVVLLLWGVLAALWPFGIWYWDPASFVGWTIPLLVKIPGAVLGAGAILTCELLVPFMHRRAGALSSQDRREESGRGEAG